MPRERPFPVSRLTNVVIPHQPYCRYISSRVAACPDIPLASIIAAFCKYRLKIFGNRISPSWSHCYPTHLKVGENCIDTTTTNRPNTRQRITRAGHGDNSRAGHLRIRLDNMHIRDASKGLPRGTQWAHVAHITSVLSVWGM